MEKLFPIDFGKADNNKELKKIQLQYSEYDPAYITAASAAERLEMKIWLEKLWLDYQPYADREFLQRVKINFNEHTWEMYLTCSLLQNGMNLFPKGQDEGPDCKLKIKDSIVWIEAVVCKEGEETDKVIKGNYSGHRDGHDIPRILRITNAFDEKFRKYNQYIRKGTIQENDPFVIAINGSEADAYREELILGALLSVGYLTIPFDKEKKPFHQRRDHVNKKNKSPVNTDIFLDEKYKGISAVIFSRDHIINSPRDILGSKFIIVLNPLAKNPLNVDDIKLGKTRWVDGDFINVKNWHKPK